MSVSLFLKKIKLKNWGQTTSLCLSRLSLFALISFPFFFSFKKSLSPKFVNLYLSHQQPSMPSISKIGDHRNHNNLEEWWTVATIDKKWISLSELAASSTTLCFSLASLRAASTNLPSSVILWSPQNPHLVHLASLFFLLVNCYCDL